MEEDRENFPAEACKEISQEDTRQPSEEVPSDQREQHLQRLSGMEQHSGTGGLLVPEP